VLAAQCVQFAEQVREVGPVECQQGRRCFELQHRVVDLGVWFGEERVADPGQDRRPRPELPTRAHVDVAGVVLDCAAQQVAVRSLRVQSDCVVDDHRRDLRRHRQAFLAGGTALKLPAD
jgi:hypothetical protein